MINMAGHIDGVFASIPATRQAVGGGWVEGKWVEALEDPQEFTVNIQQASDREIDFVMAAGERTVDVRRIYINEGEMEGITNNGMWTFLGQRWKTVKCDNRFWHNYCKLIVVREDDQ